MARLEDFTEGSLVLRIIPHLVSRETREGQVFQRLFEKLEEEKAALSGRVFDILGKVTFDNMPFRDLLVEAIQAIRYGNDLATRARGGGS